MSFTNQVNPCFDNKQSIHVYEVLGSGWKETFSTASFHPCHNLNMLQENQQYVQYKSNGPTQHTQQPYVTGTSVLGIRFKDGVMLAADTLGTLLLI